VGKLRAVEEDVTFSQEGRIQYGHMSSIPSFIKENLGKLMTMKLSVVRPKLSDRQRRWYFVAIIPEFMDLCGYEPDAEGKDDCHRDVKERWAPRHERTNRMTGEITEYVPSLMAFTDQEMTDYLDRLLRELAQMGRPVPDPRPGWKKEKQP
jgi:hypothetical protein